MAAIVVSNLGKAYKQYSNRWGRLLEWLTPGNATHHNLKWVLQDINFTVNAGEAVGIIGINGAGKSTLLKLITGTTQPTTGSVQMTGRVAALLELGMGFHPDFTGRQNAFMAGQLLGIADEDIALLMPEIEAFSEIGDYINQPVRVYSSGMQMRLAFSVATVIRPDILIVDEALSVGDASFQHKSFSRIREFRKLGTTLLIVSHDKGAIQSICDRAILLSGSRSVMEGEPEAVMNYYNAMIAQHGNSKIEQINLGAGKKQTISGTGEAEIESVSIVNSNGENVEVLNVGESTSLKITVRSNADLPELVLGYLIKDRFGQSIFGTNTKHLGAPLKRIKAGDRMTYKFTFPANMGEGSYSVTIALHADETHIAANYVWNDRVIIFNVVNINRLYFTGVAWLHPEWEVQRD